MSIFNYDGSYPAKSKATKLQEAATYQALLDKVAEQPIEAFNLSYDHFTVECNIGDKRLEVGSGSAGYEGKNFGQIKILDGVAAAKMGHAETWESVHAREKVYNEAKTVNAQNRKQTKATFKLLKTIRAQLQTRQLKSIVNDVALV